MRRMLANGQKDQGSIPDQVISNTQKMVLGAALFNTQHYNVRIKGKEEQSREKKSRPSLHLGVVAIEKGAFGSPSIKVTNLPQCMVNCRLGYIVCKKFCSYNQNQAFRSKLSVCLNTYVLYSYSYICMPACMCIHQDNTFLQERERYNPPNLHFQEKNEHKRTDKNLLNHDGRSRSGGETK